MEDKNFGLKTAVEETERYFKEQIDSIETFKAHQSRLLTSLSLIITTFSFLLSRIEFQLIKISWLLITIGSLFLLYIIIYACLIMPVSMETPIEIESNTLREAFAKSTEKIILENKLENYLKAIKLNKLTINKLIRWSRLSIVIFILIVIIAFINFCVII